MGAIMADEAKKGMLDRLVERIGNLGSSGQSTAQSNAAAQNLQALADKFKDGQCTASRPELMAIANNADKPIMAGAVQSCRENIQAAGYPMKGPGG